MGRHRIAQVGCGYRGVVHLDAVLRNSDRFELVGLCDLDPGKLAGVAEPRGISGTYTDAERMLAETRPEVFCFVTQPNVRLGMVELAVRYGVKGIALEKPMATSLREAKAIRDLCTQHGIKAVVSHQQKYLTSMQKLNEIVRAGDLGTIETMQSTGLARLSQLGTHFVDYALWINGGHHAQWVCGHAHGKGGLTDSHPSCDYVAGTMQFSNGTRGYVEFGYLSPRHMDDSLPDWKPGPRYWLDNRLTVYGTHGYAWADTDGRWGAFTRETKGEVIGEVGEPWGVQEATRVQPPYFRDLADWLDDDSRVHPCNLEISYHGYEIMEALCLSALDSTRIDLPLADPSAHEDVWERMRRELSDVPPMGA